MARPMDKNVIEMHRQVQDLPSNTPQTEQGQVPVQEFVQAVHQLKTELLTKRSVNAGRMNDLSWTRSKGRLTVKLDANPITIEWEADLAQDGVRWSKISPYVYAVITVIVLGILAWNAPELFRVALTAIESLAELFANAGAN